MRYESAQISLYGTSYRSGILLSLTGMFGIAIDTNDWKKTEEQG